MKEIKEKEGIARNIMTTSEFKGYTIEEIRFQRAMVAMQADFCKNKFFKGWTNVQRMNPLSPSSDSSLPAKAGSIALKMVRGLNYIDYILLGFSVFNGLRKFTSFFHKVKRK